MASKASKIETLKAFHNQLPINKRNLNKRVFVKGKIVLFLIQSSIKYSNVRFGESKLNNPLVKEIVIYLV